MQFGKNDLSSAVITCTNDQVASLTSNTLTLSNLTNETHCTINLDKYKYTIAYNANGGNGAPSSQTKTSGVDLTLSSTIPTRFGYTFGGWRTSSSSTSYSYLPGGTYTSDTSRTLYAIWKNPTVLYGDIDYWINISIPGTRHYFEFTPSCFGTYVFKSYNEDSNDPRGIYMILQELN